MQEPSIPKKMRAIPFRKVCKPDELKIEEWDTPVISSKEVLIQVKAFGLSFADVYARKGQYGPTGPFPFVPGYEVAGIIAAVGAEVTAFKIGQKVMAGTFNFGAYAEYAKTISDVVIELPSDWSFAAGASVLVNYITAYHCLYATGYLFEGTRVLIHSAAGGVGLAATQLALHSKCEIYGTCSSNKKVELLKTKGVHFPINYREKDFETEVLKLTNGEGVDIVIDSIGGSFIKKDFNVVRPNGRVVGIGATASLDRSFGNTFSLISNIFSMMTLNSIDMIMKSKSFCGVNMKELADHSLPLMKRELKDLLRLFEEGSITPDVHTELSWKEVGKAHQMLEDRTSTGKIVLLID